MIFEILPNPDKDKGLTLTKKIMSVLQKHGCDIYMPPEFSSKLGKCGVIYGESDAPDITVVLGGDGSIMRAAQKTALNGSSVLGINLGRVGYLAEINPSEIDKIDNIFSGEYRVEKRMMLEVSHIRDSKQTGDSKIALNDAVVSHGKVSKLAEIELLCNDNNLGKYRSDGFIVSTPTGSTAYSLSAGGPVVDPALHGICLVPICSHSLMARPIIVPDDSVIEIRNLSVEKGSLYLTVDGEESDELEYRDSVRIVRSDYTFDLIRMNYRAEKNFYSILRNKISEI